MHITMTSTETDARARWF